MLRANEVAAAVGSEVVSSTPVTGGSICVAHTARLADGRRVFVKSHPSPPDRMFEKEAHGLEWLRAGAPDGLVIPAVIAVGEAMLILEYLQPAAASPQYDEALGRSLADLHRSLPTTAPFGLECDNYLAVLPQRNLRTESWAEFYWTQRLEPLLARATGANLVSSGMMRSFRALEVRIDRLVGPAEPASRLHGDLWGGNRMTSLRGPALFDPAAYAGHREIDLAMMELFGGFEPRVFEAYAEHHPLAPDAAARTSLYQLYPLMAHLCMFGGGYRGAVEAALDRSMST